MSDFEDRKRIAAFRRALVAEIPRFPNTKTSKDALEAKSFTELLLAYVGWRLRFVAQRPRQVLGQASVGSNPEATTLAPNIGAFIAAAAAGEDLTPYLSLGARKEGYTPAAAQPATSWADKDFLLNVMGYHHFHLGLELEDDRDFMRRTKDVIFAHVSRTHLEIIGLFDHQVFEGQGSGDLNAERERLWKSYEEHQGRGLQPGALAIGGLGGLGIAGRGMPVAATIFVQRLVSLMRETDPKLDDRTYVFTLFEPAIAPAKPKFQWGFAGNLDFSLQEKTSGTFFKMSDGPN